MCATIAPLAALLPLAELIKAHVFAAQRIHGVADVASKARNHTSGVISPIAFAAVQKFDAIFALERGINGLSPDQRLAARRRDVAPLVKDLMA